MIATLLPLCSVKGAYINLEVNERAIASKLVVAREFLTMV